MMKNSTHTEFQPFQHAVWISCPHREAEEEGARTTYALRTSFLCSAAPVKAVVHVTADSRYILWVNGRQVGRGPARCWPWLQSVDTCDLAPFLRQGENWIAVQVHSYGESNCIGLYRGKTGLIIEGRVEMLGGATVDLRTGLDWHTRLADWQRPSPANCLNGQTGRQERYDARLEPEGWRTGEDGPAGWVPALVVARPGDAPWTGFEPRGIKPLAEEPLPPSKICWAARGPSSAVDAGARNLWVPWRDGRFEPLPSTPVMDNEGWLTVHPSPGESVAVAFEYPWSQTGYAFIEVKAARGGELLDCGYGRGDRGPDGRPIIPGDDFKGGVFSPDDPRPCGWFDRFVPRPGDGRWQSFDIHGFRYQVVVVRADHPVTFRVRAVNAFHDTGEPLPFACEDPLLDRIWEISHRTLRAGMVDAYVDNAWREQCQWLGDACVSMLAAWVTYGDTDLFVRGMRQWGESSRMTPEGSLLSVVPKENIPYDIIADYNLAWIHGLADHWMLTGNPDLARSQHAPLRHLLMNVFERGRTREGLYAPPPGIPQFLDWVDRPWDKSPYNLTFNLMALRALRSTREIALKVLADTELASFCGDRADALTDALVTRFWDPAHKAWREHLEPDAKSRELDVVRDWSRDPWHDISVGQAKARGGILEPTPWTRHGNAMAVLLQLGTPEQCAEAARRVVEGFLPGNDGNNGMSPLWTDRIFGAMFQSGHDVDAVRLLHGSYGKWIADGAVQWGEGWNASANTCAQTWGASVNWLLTSFILGIRPLEPGFRKAVFDPRPGPIAWARGIVPTPHGPIRVEWHRDADGRIVRDRLDVPSGIAIL